MLLDGIFGLSGLHGVIPLEMLSPAPINIDFLSLIGPDEGFSVVEVAVALFELSPPFVVS